MTPIILPEWVTIIGVIGMPIVGLLSVIFTYLHIGSKVKEVRGDVNTLEVKINSKMDRLLELTEKSARAEGVIEGKASALADAKTLADRAHLDAGLRAEGATDLLAAQQTPPAEHQP